MRDTTRQFLLGAAAIFWAPLGLLPRPQYRITVPELTAKDALAGDFARIGADFRVATRKIEKATQLELSI